MVLVDASPVEQDRLYEPLAEVLPSETPGECLALKQLRHAGDHPTENPEHLDLRASARQVAATGDLRDLPLVVLTAARPHLPPCVSQPLVEAEAQLWRTLQEELTQLSTRSTHIIAEKSSHYIQNDQPDLVIAAIRQILDVARTDAHVAPP